MKPLDGPSEHAAPRALFLSPEAPVAGSGGGGLRSASLLEYLRRSYSVDVADFTLKPHSKSFAAKAWRNSVRLLRGVPPLFDRYSGYEDQLATRLGAAKYELGVLEHFWCAKYAPMLRAHCRMLVMDLHNIESDLAQTHAQAARWPASWASGRFAEAYRRLEREWLPSFDILLVTSEEDAGRVERLTEKPRVIVYPNAMPEIPVPSVPEENCIVFSGNLEYHPNREAVRWFRSSVWPRIRERSPGVEWRLIGKNPEAVAQWTSGDDRIRVVGPVEDAVAEIARGKVAVVPLLSGSGTRFKILEAWAAVRAVVSTPIGAAGLGGLDGEHLLIAEGAEEFAGAVLRLLKDAPLRAKLGHAGRALYVDRFTWPVAWERLRSAGI
jgi:glycosyltransferase involved in cell wall biosynthesis